MIETEIARMIADDSAITEIVDNRIMDMDFRATDWENAINYENEPIAIMGYGGFIHPCIVVDAGEVQRSLNLRGAGRYMQPVTIWIFTPRGRVGMGNSRIVRDRIIRMHEESLPSRPMMMLRRSIGPLDDGKNLITQVTMDVTFIPQEAGYTPAEDHEEIAP